MLCHAGELVFFGEAFKIVVEVLVPEFHLAEVAVRFKHIVRSLNDGNGNIGTVVGDTFVIVQNIRQYKAGLDRANALLQPLDVVRLDVSRQVVNDLFERFDVGSIFLIEGNLARIGVFQNFVDRILGEMLSGLVDLLGTLGNIDGMVTEPFKVPDRPQPPGTHLAVML